MRPIILLLIFGIFSYQAQSHFIPENHVVTVIKNDNDKICSGFLLSPNWILTSASCGHELKTKPGAFAEKGSQKLNLTSKYLHPFNSEYQYDVALLRTEASFDNTPSVFNAVNDRFPIPTQLYGFGKNEGVGPRKYNLEVVSDAECSEFLPHGENTFPEGTICLKCSENSCEVAKGSILLTQGSNHIIGVIADSKGKFSKTFKFSSRQIYSEFVEDVILKHAKIDAKPHLSIRDPYQPLFMVSIHVVDREIPHIQEKICAGALLSKRWIITAAHCFKPYENNLNLEFYSVSGVYNFDLKIDEYFQEIKINQFFIHHHYKPGEVANDIALAYLSGPVKFAPWIVQLPEDENYVPKKRKGVSMSGYAISTSGDLENYLNHGLTMFRNFEEISAKECANGEPEEYILCMRSQGTHGCGSDTGGPLYDEADEILYGITTIRSTPCGLGPQVFTKIGPHLPYIKHVMSSRSS